MSTNDVPGAVAHNNDELALGCWAENPDRGGSLVYVMENEGGNVIYSMFDLGNELEYRDSMPAVAFKKAFSWKAGEPPKPGLPNVKWTWHDKTKFPWDLVMKSGIADGPRPPSVDSIRSAAERVAESLRLHAQRIDAGRFGHMTDTVSKTVGGIRDKISRAIGELRK